MHSSIFRTRSHSYKLLGGRNTRLPAVSAMAQLHPPHVEEAQLVAVHERRLNPKRFVFQVDIKWSDGNKTTSYRSYSEFFNFQCELLIDFPQEAGSEKGTERTLPYLPGKQILRRSNKQLAEERLPIINKYVQDLLALPELICRSERVLRFFRSNWQEDRICGSEAQGSLARDSGSTAIKYSVKHLSKSRGPLNDTNAIAAATPFTAEEENELSLSDGPHIEINGIN